MMNQELMEKLELFFAGHKLLKFKKGEMILMPGENVKYVGFLKSGYVRMYSINENGTEVTVQFFKPILLLTTILAYTGVENRYYFEAITPVEMYTASVGETLGYFQDNKPLLMELMNMVMVSFLDLIDNFSFLLAGNAYNKVAKMVVDLNHRSQSESNTKETFGVTHKLIASLTGLTRETVTLQMLRLEKEGIIENKNKKVFVMDWKKLEEATKSDAK